MLRQTWDATAIGTRRDNGREENIGKVRFGIHVDYMWHPKRSSGGLGMPILIHPPYATVDIRYYPKRGRNYMTLDD